MQGNVKSKIKDYGTMMSKNGNLNAVVSFDVAEVQPDGSTRLVTLNWLGAFTPKAMESTLRTLLTLGFPATAGRDLSSISDGPQTGLLNMDKEFDLVLEEEVAIDANGQAITNPDGNLKMRTRIRFINDPERAPGIVKADKATAYQFLANTNCEGTLIEVARSMGLLAQAQAANPNPNYAQQNVTRPQVQPQAQAYAQPAPTQYSAPVTTATTSYTRNGPAVTAPNPNKPVNMNDLPF